MIWFIALLFVLAGFGFWKFVANFNEEERRNKESLDALVQFHRWGYAGPSTNTKWQLTGQCEGDTTWRLTYERQPDSEAMAKLRWHLDLPAKNLCLHIQSAKVIKMLRSPTGLVLSDIVGALAKNAIGADFTSLTTFVAVAQYTQLDDLLGACATIPVQNLAGPFAESAPSRQSLQAEWSRSGLIVSIPATEDTAQIESFINWCLELAQRVQMAQSSIKAAS